jgi:hypothetical protein
LAHDRVLRDLRQPLPDAAEELVLVGGVHRVGAERARSCSRIRRHCASSRRRIWSRRAAAAGEDAPACGARRVCACIRVIAARAACGSAAATAAGACCAAAAGAASRDAARIKRNCCPAVPGSEITADAIRPRSPEWRR